MYSYLFVKGTLLGEKRLVRPANIRQNPGNPEFAQ